MNKLMKHTHILVALKFLCNGLVASIGKYFQNANKYADIEKSIKSADKTDGHSFENDDCGNMKIKSIIALILI